MSQHYKLILVILVAALGGMWIGYSLDSDKNKNPDYTSQQASSSVATDQALINQLQQQVQQLQSENRQLAQQLHVQTHSVDSSSSQRNIDQKNVDRQLHDKLEALEMEKHQRNAEDFGAWALNSQKANPNFNLDKELSNRFQQESRDPVWAEQQENYYQQLFSSQEELRDFALRNAQCRSTQCEVTISVSNSEQSQQLLQTMTRTLQGSVILLSSDDGSGTSKLYIGRDEKSFEFN